MENAIAELLRGAGHEVRQHVGYAGFRVDLAVVDPRQPGRYLLGIECDGPKYYESRVARDRDRLRHQILENLGWTVHRVWSVDWYRDRVETIERLLRAVEEAKVARPPIVAPVVAVEIVSTENPVELEPPSADDAAAYETCDRLRIATTGELHLVSTEELLLAVEDVVSVEGPVHAEEVVRRIRTLWGLQRAGNRIREAVDRAIDLAARRKVVARDGEFLHIPNATIRVRRRNGDPPARIDLIADAEIAESLRSVLRTQFATPRPGLIAAAARRLGILATSAAVTARVNGVIDAEVGRGAIEEEGDTVRSAAPCR